MKKDIREIIKNNILDTIKEASTEEERYKAIINFQEFARALTIEASIEFIEWKISSTGYSTQSIQRQSDLFSSEQAI